MEAHLLGQVGFNSLFSDLCISQYQTKRILYITKKENGEKVRGMDLGRCPKIGCPLNLQNLKNVTVPVNSQIYIYIYICPLCLP